MVRLIDSSSISAEKYPTLSEWDSMVRKNYNLYQRLIDAKTYQLQRVQRYLFSVKYPQKYDSDLITLNLLKKKQRVGEVTRQEIDSYSSINSNIRSEYNRTFGSWVNIPKLGFTVGAGLFLFGTIFSHSVPTKFMYFVTPIVADYFWTLRNPKSQIASSEFLDWVFEYRKAKVFNQRYKHVFSNPQTKKVLGDVNIAALGQQLIKIAGH